MNHRSARKLMLAWTREAGTIILTTIKSANLGISLKADNIADIVTNADTASEDYLRGQITKYFPNDSILGEERMARKGKSPYIWVIDPVDGTTIMAQGMDYFGVSIGLWKDGEPQVGVVFFPKLNILLETEKDRGTFIDGKRIAFRNLGEISVAPVIAFDYSAEKDRQLEAREYLIPLLPHIRYPLSYCSSVYSALLLLQNKLHAFLHPAATLYDLGAITLAVREAGGEYVVLDTGEKNIDLRRPRTPIVMASSAELAERLREILKSTQIKDT